MTYLVIVIGSMLVWLGRYQLLANDPAPVRVWWSYLFDPMLSVFPLLFALIDVQLMAALWLVSGMAVCVSGYISGTKLSEHAMMCPSDATSLTEATEQELERIRSKMTELERDPEVAALLRAFG